jgi:hypothetical protein
MNIKREVMRGITGEFKANVRIENIGTQISGSFEVDDYGSEDTLKMQIEMAVRSQLEIEIISIKKHPNQGEKSEG